MFKAVWRFVRKSGAVSALFAALLAISALLATVSAADAAATGSLTTTHWKSGTTAEGYILNLAVPNPDGTIDTVTLASGSGITAPVPLTVVDPEISTDFTWSREQTTAPAVGDSYILDVVYLNGTPPESITVQVTGVLGSFATPVAPIGGIASAASPAFSWSAPATLPAGDYSYLVSYSLSGSSVESGLIGSDTATYTFATAPTAGITYDWAIAVVDADGNRSESRGASFTIGANFQGRVTDLDGVGVPGVGILVFNSAGVPQSVGNVVTQADGSYIFGGLFAGSYRVAFNKAPDALVYYSYKLFSPDANLVIVKTGSVVTGVDYVVGAGAISGKAVNASNQVIQGLLVQASDTAGVVKASSTTAIDGTYFLASLPAGSYKVKISGTGYTPQWANSGNNISVSAGDTTEVSSTTMSTLNISGSVTDTSGNPVAGIWVYLYDSVGNLANFSGAQTQADGSYAIGGMAGGTYYVLFDTLGTSFLKQYYNRKGSLTLADPVVISSTPLSNINAVLGNGIPVITSFTVPATSASFTVTGITLTAVEGNGIAGYLLTESAIPPEVSAAGWSATAPTSYIFSSIGDKTLYAWAKGTTGAISASAQQPVTISASAMKSGDCDSNGSVTISEVQSAVNMYLGMKVVEQCVDQDNSGTTSIAEVQKAINSFLGL